MDSDFNINCAFKWTGSENLQDQLSLRKLANILLFPEKSKTSIDGKFCIKFHFIVKNNSLCRMDGFYDIVYNQTNMMSYVPFIYYRL